MPANDSKILVMHTKSSLMRTNELSMINTARRASPAKDPAWAEAQPKNSLRNSSAADSEVAFSETEGEGPRAALGKVAISYMLSK